MRMISKGLSIMDILAELERAGAILHGHFCLSSGRHSDIYYEKFRLLEKPSLLLDLCRELVEPFRSCVDVIAGPTTGGALVAQLAALALGVEARYVEREDGVRALRRGACIPPGSKILLVDDVMTTGQSLRECLHVLGRGDLVGIAVILARGPVDQTWPVRVHSLQRIDASDWQPDACPLCELGLPLSHPGTSPVGPASR